MQNPRQFCRYFGILSALDRLGLDGSLTNPRLPDGVMVAQVTLTHLVMVRIHVGQPFVFSLRTPEPTGMRKREVAEDESQT